MQNFGLISFSCIVFGSSSCSTHTPFGRWDVSSHVRFDQLNGSQRTVVFFESCWVSLIISVKQDKRNIFHVSIIQESSPPLRLQNLSHVPLFVATLPLTLDEKEDITASKSRFIDQKNYAFSFISFSFASSTHLFLFLFPP